MLVQDINDIANGFAVIFFSGVFIFMILMAISGRMLPWQNGTIGCIVCILICAALFALSINNVCKDPYEMESQGEGLVCVYKPWEEK